jgi:hypothetical protein
MFVAGLAARPQFRIGVANHLGQAEGLFHYVRSPREYWSRRLPARAYVHWPGRRDSLAPHQEALRGETRLARGSRKYRVVLGKERLPYSSCGPIHHSDNDWRRDYLVSVDKANGSNFRFHGRINVQALG